MSRVVHTNIWSAYGYARKAGYEGTEEEFEQGLKKSAEAAGNAEESASTASEAAAEANAARDAAAQSAESASTSEGNALEYANSAAQVLRDAQAVAQTVNAKANEAAGSASRAENYAQTATTKASEATTAAGTATAAATSASGSAQEADASATAAAASETNAAASASSASTYAGNASESADDAAESAAAAQAVKDSIPEDYTALSDEVTDLKSALTNSIVETTVNKGTLVSDEYVKFETGEFLSYGGWARTDYLPCDDYTEIKLSIRTQYSAFYDANKAYISKADFYANTYLSVPSNAKYFAISGTANSMNTAVVTAKTKTFAYTVNEKISNIENVTFTDQTETSQSLIDGYFVSDTSIPVASTDWVCTDLIPMPFDEKTSYVVRGTFYGIAGCAIYDSENNVLSYVVGNNVSEYGGTAGKTLQTVNIPHIDGAKKIRISGWKTNVSDASDLWIKGNTFNGVYKRLYNAEKNIAEIKANISTTIASSKVLVIGDSISSDSYANYAKWVTVLKNQGFLPSDTTNSSQHATGFVARYNNGANDFITRLKAIQNPETYDLVVVFGGINDYIQNIPMGSASGTDYTVSFKPAVNEFFSYLIQNFTQARLCVLLPLRTYATWKNSVDEFQQAYGDYIKQVAKSYCLPVLNLTEDSGFCPYISTFSDMWTLLPEGFQSHDGVHPNEEYERRFLAPMIKHFLQGLM